MTKAEIALKFLQLPKVGRKTAFKLMREINFSPSNDLDLIDFIKGINGKIKLPDYTHLEFGKAFDKANLIIEKSYADGIILLSYFDKDFPLLLKTVEDAPLVLNFKGAWDSLNTMPCVAIIGTRDPSTHGFQVGKKLGNIFGSRGFNVVSGLAIGCDSSGHQGCLEANGITTAVLAHGLDTVYPKTNRKLSEEIIDKGGCLVSEYFIGTAPLGNYFVERDRIQAGLSSCVIVVETDIKSGTMHTVNSAKKENRLVAAYNHKPEFLIGNIKAKGTQMLINERIAIPLGNPEEIERLILLLTDQNAQSAKHLTNQSKLNEPQKEKLNPSKKPSTLKRKSSKKTDTQTKINFDEGNNT